jgi:hypothetical protein
MQWLLGFEIVPTKKNTITNSTKFKTDGYCVVENTINTDLRDVITQYALFDEMQNYTPELDHEQVPNAHSRYGDPAMEAMLLHLHDIMEKNTGLTLFPTYSYYRVYRNGDELAPHSDRESCEISATLCFNVSYDTTEFSWPIFMNGNSVILNPGDMVIYRGCDLPHWRDKLLHNEEIWHVQGFFHYVDANGPYSNFKFDKRESIGAITKKNKLNAVPAVKSYIKFT